MASLKVCNRNTIAVAVKLVSLFMITSHFLMVASSKPKCIKPETNHTMPYITTYPEVKVISQSKLKTSYSVALGRRKIMIPAMLEKLEIQCLASYKVQWGFETYPWATFETWTGAVIPVTPKKNDNTTEQLYTATIVFHNIQDTSFQGKVPICYSIKDPCIQTAVESQTGTGAIEMWFTQGSNYSIQLKPVKEQFGKNQNCSLQMAFDAVSQRFYCKETNPDTDLAGKIFLKPCSDLVTCESFIAASNCPMMVVPPISDCTLSNRCRTETSHAGSFPGIAVCHSGNAPEHSAAMPYFYGLHTSNFSKTERKRYLRWNDVNSKDMLQISSFKDGPMYTKQNFTVACNASYYYLGSGMYFKLFKEDSPSVGVDGETSIESGNKEDEISQAVMSTRDQLKSAKETILETEDNVSGLGYTKLPTIRSLTKTGFHFEVPGRYKLTCLAPVWNTTEWAEVSTLMVVTESTVPKIVGGEKTYTRAYEPNLSLECRADGIPKPEINWVRDGGPVPLNGISFVSGEENYTSSVSVWKTLTLVKSPDSEHGITGNFTCTAANVAGKSSTTYIITPPDKDSSVKLWILLAFFISMAALILLVLYLMWKVRHQRKHIEDLSQEEVEEFLNGRPDYIPFQCDMSTYAYYLPYNKKYEISRDSLEIDLTKILGSGEYGLVLYGLYKNANPEGGTCPVVKPVAIKTTKPISSGKEHFKALLSELKIMTYLEHHANIVNLVGACTQNVRKREVFIATEFCENGSLLSYLRMNRYACENPLFYAELMNPTRGSSRVSETSFINAPTLTSPGGMLPRVPDVQYIKMEDLGNISINNMYENIHNIKLQDLMHWSLDIALGMEFLTSKKVIHGDLAARNVMLTKDLRCKIGDFGLSRQLYHYTYYTKTAKTPLPIKWLAIECLQNFQFSVESDVWAYGITLFEIFSIGEMPYSSVEMNGEEFLKALKHGMRLSKPPYAPIEVFRLMMKCWRNDKRQRPSFPDIVNFFRAAMDKGEYQNIVSSQ